MRVLYIGEVARMLGLSRWTLRGLVHKGLVPYRQNPNPNAKYHWHLEDVETIKTFMEMGQKAHENKQDAAAIAQADNAESAERRGREARPHRVAARPNDAAIPGRCAKAASK